MEFRILGPLEVVDDGGHALALPAPQQRALLALLLINPNRVLSPDRILEAVWGDEPPATGTRALTFHVSRLRDALAPGRRHGDRAGALQTEAAGYVLRVEPDAIDAARFERLAREAHQLLPVDPAAARSRLAEALGLWRGEALADVAYADFAQAEIRRLDELRLGAQEDRLEAELALGGHLTAVAELEGLLAPNPLRDRLRGLLMLALYRSGRQAEALRVAGTGRRLLSEELGIDPSPELVRLEALILAQDPGLDLPRGPVAHGERARNPYKGLRAFGEADSADFFGREHLVRRLLVRLEEVVRGSRLLAIVGPSGSGKSSVVRAGLVPALRARAAADGSPWRIAMMVPGGSPFRELAAALITAGRPVDAALVEQAERTGDLAPIVGEALAGGADARLLLVIDQLEELFVRVDEAARDRFVGGLVEALRAPGSWLVVVATLRADFLHLPLLIPELGELVRGGIEIVTPMARAELERAIVQPAEAVGAEVEPGLVTEIIADVEHRPGVLPLLEYALTELFDRRHGRQLTRDGYAAIGGAVGALGRRADEAWRSLNADGRETAEQVLLRLVALTEGGVATTRRAPRAELESLPGDPQRVRAILDDLGRRGLLTFDLDPVTGAPTVQIAHEALLVHWPRLADWIEDLRRDLWARHRLADAVDEWEAAGRSPEDLAGGAKLDRFEAWAGGTRLRLTEAERDYLAASAMERERRVTAEAVRLAGERRLERRARFARLALVGVVVAGIALAGVLGADLSRARQAQVEQGPIASARELAAASIAGLGKDRQLSVLLALAAADATAGSGYVVEEAYDALHWALQEAQVPYPVGQVPAGVRPGPGGARGVFLVAPETLMRLGSEYIRRYRTPAALAPDDCRTYLHRASCPAVEPPADGVRLEVWTAAGVVPATSLAEPTLGGSRVRVLSELPADLSPLAPSLDGSSGVTIEWDPALGGDLEARIDARDLPDVAIVSRPSYVAAAARQGWLVDLDGRVDTSALGPDAGEYVMGRGVATGPAPSGSAIGRYGAPLAASVDDLLWYPAAAFAAAGYAPPTTTAELDTLVARIRADGRVPWCLGTEDGSRSGSAAAAWVEGRLLDAAGPAGYDRWTGGAMRFGTEAVISAFDGIAQLVVRPTDVLNGVASAGGTPERIAAWPMLWYDTPECWLFRGASTDRAAFPPGGAARAAAVPFPGREPGSRSVLGRLYTIVVLHDRPEVRQVVEALLGAPFAEAIASGLAGNGIFPIRAVDVRADAVTVAQVARLRAGLAADTFRVRAVDLFPGPVAASFLRDVTRYLDQGPSYLDISGFEADWAWLEVRDGETP